MDDRGTVLRQPTVQTVLPGVDGVYVVKSNRCVVCGRSLKSEPCISIGIGPKCAKKTGYVLPKVKREKANAEVRRVRTDDSVSQESVAGPESPRSTTLRLPL